MDSWQGHCIRNPNKVALVFFCLFVCLFLQTATKIRALSLRSAPVQNQCGITQLVKAEVGSFYKNVF